MQWVVLDFETASNCDLKRAGAWRYAEDPTTEIVCLGYSLMGQPPIPMQPKDIAAHDSALLALVNDPAVIFVAHNAGFEKAIWRKIVVPQFGWPDIPNSRWHDSMAVCAMKAIPLDLDHAAIILRLPYRKDTEGSRLTKSLSKASKSGCYDRSPATLQKVYDYNLQDVRTQVALHERLGCLPLGERNVWLLDQRINERGVRLDLPFVRAAQQIVERASVPLVAEFQALTGGLKPTQVQKIGAWAKEAGAALPDLAKETLDAVLGSDDEDADTEEWNIELPPAVHRALSIRRLIGSASVKKLGRMIDCVCEDGRVRGTLQYHAAGPGRWGGRLFQPQNFPRGTLMVDGKPPDPGPLVSAIMSGDPALIEALYGPPVETIVASLRHALIPNRGRLFVAGDFSGIEARIVLSLAGQHDKTKLMAEGADVYCDMAAAIFGRPIDKEKDPKERQTGKNSVLGLGFQMGAPKFRSRYAKDKPLEFAKNVVDTYRKKWAPLVPEVWYDLEEAALRTVVDRVPHEAYGVTYALEDRWMTARLPSGRKLWYFNPRETRKAMPWDENDIRLAWTYNARKMGKWITVDAFGGLLTENVVQGLARDLMVHAAFKAEKEGLPICLTVHDEIVGEPEERFADSKVLEQIMCDRPPWAVEMQVPVHVVGWVGDRYKK